MAKKKQIKVQPKSDDRAAKHPFFDPTIARGANVRDYFYGLLGRPPRIDRFNELADLLCDSACGADCVAAIKAARELLNHVESATGRDYPSRNDMVLEVAAHVCLTYYLG